MAIANPSGRGRRKANAPPIAPDRGPTLTSSSQVIDFVLGNGGHAYGDHAERRNGAAIPTPTLASGRSAFRFIDLFCGIGGFRLAFERAGARCVFSSDWDKFSRQTYAANFGEEPAGDINAIPVADIPAHDILCGGFPCQPFSLAGVSKKNSLGKKHGFEDERQGNLLFSIAAILEHPQPREYVLE